MKKYLTLLLLFSLNSEASWTVGLGTGSYMGDRHVGVGYVSDNQKHFSEISYGKTEGILSSEVDQINLKYVFSPFEYVFDDKIKTNILGFGILLSRWQSSDAFLQSESQYPEEYYYSQTRYRTSVVISQTWSYQNLQVYVDWVMLDQKLIALFNNDEYWRERNAWTSGFGMRWQF